MKVRSLLLFALLTVLPSSAGATTVEARPWAGPVAAGAGRTGRIIRLDLTPIVLSPGAVSSRPVYTFGLQFDHDLRDRSYRLSMGAVDSKTNPLSVGSVEIVEWRRPDLDPDRDLAWWPHGEEAPKDNWFINRTFISLGYGLFDRRLNVGASLNILATKRGIRPDQNRVTLNAGVVGFPLPSLGLQVSVRNAIPTKMAIAPTILSTGAAVLLSDIVYIEVDVDTDFTSFDKPKIDLYGGTVVRIWSRLMSTDGQPQPLISIRAGYFSEENFGLHNVTWGLGWVGSRGQLHYGMGIAVSPMDKILRGKRTYPGRIAHTITIAVAL